MLQKNVARSEGGGDSKIRASSKISKALSPKISINGDDVACVAALWLRVPASPRRALAYTAVTGG